MANPLDSLKNLKPWQQGAVVVGGLGVVGVVVWQRQKAKKTAAATPVTPAGATPTAPAAAAVPAGTVDPTTGQVYPAGAVDPETQIPYDQEIAEYGSVSAADAAAAGGYSTSQQGVNGGSYVEQNPSGTGSTGTPVSTNAQWMTEVESGLSEQGYSTSDIGQGIASYFASRPLSLSSDGTDLYTMMNLAVSEYGPPPTGSYPLLNGSGKSQLPGTGNAVVPNVVGRADLDTAEGIIKAAGLDPKAAGDSGAGNKGKITAQSPAAGSTVDKGSSVTLTYTVGGGGTGGGSEDVEVPNVVGRADLDTAEGIIKAAGLEAKSTGASAAGNGGSVTRQVPAAGTTVKKGSTVTLTYTVTVKKK